MEEIIVKKEEENKVELFTLESYKKVMNMINDYNKKYGRSVKRGF